MKMKKMLAILAALSVLGTTGLTVGAEDTATTTEPATEAITTTEPATEAITTTETEAETTAAETTAETETTVETDVTEETAATEENQVVGKIGETAEFTFNGIKFQAVEVDPEDFDSSDPLFQSGCVGLIINRIEEDGSVTATNLTKIALFMKGDGGDGSHTGINKDVLEFLSIDGDILTIDAIGGSQSYQYVDGQFVPAGTAPTTTAATTDSTTTTTTTTTGTKEEVVTGDFVLDGVTLTPKVEYSNKEPGEGEAWLYLNIYSQDGTLLVSVPVEGYNGGSERPADYGKINRYLVKTGSNTVTVVDHTDYSGVVKYHTYIFENGKFVSTGTTTDDNQEKTFTVEIPTSYVKAFCYKRGEEITESNYKDSMVISCTTITGCTNGTVSIVPNGYFVGGFIVENAKPGTITITGTTGTFSSSEDPNVNTSHGQCGAGIGDRLDSFTVTVTIDENGNIVTGGSTIDDNQEKAFTVEIPYAYFTVINSITGEVITTPGANKSMVNAAVTSCTNGNVASLNYGNEVSNDLGAFLQSITVSDVKPGTLTIKGTCESYSFLSPELVAAGYTTLPHAGDAIGHYFTLTVTIDENGNIVTGGSDNGDSGKTDNGSASNAPATKNTSGTPKTGDTTTVPAVAVGLTLTAAGVVAFISKRKK